MRLWAVGLLALLASGCKTPYAPFDAGAPVHVIVTADPAPWKPVMIRPVTTLGPLVRKSPTLTMGGRGRPPGVEVALFTASVGTHRLSIWEERTWTDARADIEVGAYVPVCISGDRAYTAETLRVRVKGPMHMASVPGADLTGQPAAVRNATLRLGERYDVRHHDVRAGNPLGALVEPEVAGWFGIGGPPGYVAERLLELAGLGYDYFFFADLPPAEREALTGEVMPAVRRETPA